MGGFGSGRKPNTPVVEDTFALNVQRLVDLGVLTVSTSATGTLDSRRGEFGFQSHLGTHSGALEVYWTSINRRTGQTRERRNRIELTSRPQTFGGLRWFFVCPVTGKRATNLYLPPNADIFASRNAHGLGYRSQRQTPFDHALSQAFALREKVGGTGGIGEHIPKPKWMHRRTFKRALARIEEAEDVVIGHMLRLWHRRPWA